MEGRIADANSETNNADSTVSTSTHSAMNIYYVIQPDKPDAPTLTNTSVIRLPMILR